MPGARGKPEFGEPRAPDRNEQYLTEPIAPLARYHRSRRWRGTTDRAAGAVPPIAPLARYCEEMMLGPDFDDVLTRATAGDRSAFGQLWRDCQPMLLRYLGALAGTDAEDIASETWMAVARGLARFQGGEDDFRGWLVTIARRRLIDQRRRSARRPERLVDDTYHLERAAPDDTAALAVEHLGTGEALRLVATLPHDQAEMVLLRVVVGLEPAEIATIVKRSPGAVRVSVHRGLRTLAERLNAGRVTPPSTPAIPQHDG